MEKPSYRYTLFISKKTFLSFCSVLLSFTGIRPKSTDTCCPCSKRYLNATNRSVYRHAYCSSRIRTITYAISGLAPSHVNACIRRGSRAGKRQNYANLDVRAHVGRRVNNNNNNNSDGNNNGHKTSEQRGPFGRLNGRGNCLRANTTILAEPILFTQSSAARVIPTPSFPVCWCEPSMCVCIRTG